MYIHPTWCTLETKTQVLTKFTVEITFFLLLLIVPFNHLAQFCINFLQLLTQIVDYSLCCHHALLPHLTHWVLVLLDGGKGEQIVGRDLVEIRLQ